MSALLCCGHVFYTPYLSDDGIIYKWLDMLLTSKEEKVRWHALFVEYILTFDFAEFNSYLFICSVFICVLL